MVLAPPSHFDGCFPRDDPTDLHNLRDGRSIHEWKNEAPSLLLAEEGRDSRQDGCRVVTVAKEHALKEKGDISETRPESLEDERARNL